MAITKITSVILRFLLNAHLCAIKKCVTLFYSTSLPTAFLMTSRMQNYRDKKQQQGLVQVRVWVPHDHELFIKNIAKECRPTTPTQGTRALWQESYANPIVLPNQSPPLMVKNHRNIFMITTLVYPPGSGLKVVDRLNDH